MKTSLLVAIVLFLVSCAGTPVPADLVVENITIYSGADPEPRVATIAIRDGVFVAIEYGRRVSFDAVQRIDGSGQYLMPGLWDMHAHIRSSGDGGLDVAEFPRHGVTSILDLGGYPEAIEEVAAKVVTGETPGPTIYTVRSMLNGESFAPFQRAVTTQEEVITAVDELAAAGAIEIKIHRALSPDLLAEVLQAAHEHGLKVTGHIPLGVHPLRACELGMDSIEHVGSFVEAVISVSSAAEANSESAIKYLLSDEAEPLYECLASRGVTVTPTLIVYVTIARSRAGGKEIPPEFIAFIDNMKKITFRMHTHGVVLLAGTDTSDLSAAEQMVPGALLQEELSLLQDAGILAPQIISITTTNAATALGLEATTGSIDVGKTADFILLSADPGDDIRNVRRATAVYQSGILFDE